MTTKGQYVRELDSLGNIVAVDLDDLMETARRDGNSYAETLDALW